MSKKIMFLLFAAAMLMAATTSVFANGSQESADGPVEVRLQLKWLPQAQFNGYYVALEKGYYAEEGLDVKLLPGGPDIIPANQVSVGAADFGIINMYGLLPFVEKGFPLVSIAQTFQQSSFRLVSFKKNGIESVPDLQGKTIGAWLGKADYPIYAMLEKYGMDKDKDVVMAKQDYTMDGLISGKLDVASGMIYNEIMVLVESGYPESELNIIDVNKEGTGMLEDCLVVNSEWLAENKETAVKFLRASIKGWADACADPLAAADIIWKSLDQASTTKEHQIGMSQKIATVVSPEGFDPAKIGYFDADKIQNTVDIAAKYGIISEKLPLDMLYTTEIWEEATK